MAKNSINDLRDHLFEALEMLKDPENPMDIERARAVADISQAIINTAKVEIDLVKAVSASSPGSRKFFNMPEESRDVAPEAMRIAARKAG